MTNLEVSFNKNFELSINGSRRRERIKINNPYPKNRFSRLFFSNIGLMHLIAPYLPKTISTNFEIIPEIQALIEKMYKFEKESPPIFQLFQQPKFRSFRFSLGRTSKKRVVIAYSGGKDSMWNLWWAQEKYGPENVLAVHIKGLNRGHASRELKYVKRQKNKLKFKLKIINLLNSSRNAGFKVMRSRDIFSTGIIIPVALKFGASKIIMEGFAEPENPNDPLNYFTGFKNNIQYFNKLLKSLRIPVQISWRNRKEMNAVRDLMIHRPEWLPHICNCFSLPAYQDSFRKSWKKKAPTLARIFYDSQCGSCAKCRIITIVRILYDPVMKNVRKKDVEIYLKNTADWTQKKRNEFMDMIEGSFMKYFNKAVKKYNLKSS